MANHASALKRRARNRSVRTRLRNERRKFLEAVSAGDNAAAETQFRVLQKLFQRAAASGVVPRNTADRTIARAAARLQA